MGVLKLTEEREKLLLACGGKDYIDKNKNSLIAVIKSKEPDTPYDVQEISEKLLAANFNTKEFNQIKFYLYNNSNTKMTDVIFVMKIYLRDLALATFPVKFLENPCDEPNQKHE